MNRFFKKIIAALVIGSLLGGLIFYFWKNKFVAKKNETMVEEKTEVTIRKSEALNTDNKKKISGDKEEIINYIEKNINKISPEKPVAGSMWNPIKIWFIDDSNFYVDFRDESLILRRVLLYRSMGGPRAEYEILGFFVPGDSGWVLKSGKDIASSVSLKLYEKNEQSGEWIIK